MLVFKAKAYRKLNKGSSMYYVMTSRGERGQKHGNLCLLLVHLYAYVGRGLGDRNQKFLDMLT